MPVFLLLGLDEVQARALLARAPRVEEEPRELEALALPAAARRFIALDAREVVDTDDLRARKIATPHLERRAEEDAHLGDELRVLTQVCEGVVVHRRKPRGVWSLWRLVSAKVRTQLVKRVEPVGRPRILARIRGGDLGGVAPESLAGEGGLCLPARRPGHEDNAGSEHAGAECH